MGQDSAGVYSRCCCCCWCKASRWKTPLGKSARTIWRDHVGDGWSGRLLSRRSDSQSSTMIFKEQHPTTSLFKERVQEDDIGWFENLWMIWMNVTESILLNDWRKIQATCFVIDQSIDQPTNQPTNHSVNQSISQSISQVYLSYVIKV